MEIQALYIKAFGGLKDYSLRLGPGATLFYGPNERGKTTVLTFIRAMFYGLGERRGQDSLRERYTPRDGAAMGGNLWFYHEGVQYEMSRSFGPRKGLDQISLIDLDSNRLVEPFDPEQPGKELFGLAQEVFANSVFVESSGPRVRQSGGADQALWETLSDFMVTPDAKVTAAEVQGRLTKAKLRLRSASGRKGEIPELTARVVEMDEKVRNLAAIQDEEAGLAEELDHLQTRLGALRSQEDSLKQRLSLFEYAEDRERLRLAQLPQTELAALEPEEAQLEQALEPFGADENARRATLNKLQKELQSLLETEQRVQMTRAQRRESRCRYQNILRIAGLALAVLAVAVLLYAYFMLQGDLRSQVMAVSAVGALIGILLYGQRHSAANWIIRGKSEAAAEARSTLDGRLQQFREDCAALGYQPEAGFASSASDSGTSLQPEEQAASNGLRKLSDLPALGIFLHSVEEMLEDRQSLAKEKQRLLAAARREEEALGGRIAFGQRLEIQRQALKHAGADPDTARVDYPAADRLAEELLLLQAERLTAEKQESETRVRLESLLREPGTGAAISPSALHWQMSTELREEQNRLDTLVQRWRALELAENTLANNLLELRKKLLPRLAESAGGYMQQLSRGRYDTIQVTENLGILLRDSREGHYYSPENFSSGTEDQLWFAFRLALTDYLGEGRDLPLLLDDLFMNFDDKRAAEGLDLLAARAAEGQQVILLTCHKRIAKLAEERAGWSARTLP